MYVTKHEPRDKKYFTISPEEDQIFYRYKKSVEEYNSSIFTERAKPAQKYAKGSLLQKMLDPMAGAVRQENGAILYTIEDKELSPVL